VTKSSNHTTAEPPSRTTSNLAFRSASFAVPDREVESTPLSETSVTKSERSDANQHDSIPVQSHQPSAPSPPTHSPLPLAGDTHGPSEKRREKRAFGLSNRPAKSVKSSSQSHSTRGEESWKNFFQGKHLARVFSIKVEELSEEDMVIGVMGPTGAGKSSFIGMATGGDIGVGHELESYTTEIQIIRFQFVDINVVFVDTPGFDDTHKSDVEILTMIADWLNTTYKRNIKLSGLLYFHRISDNRMAGTPLKNLRMFQELCGHNALRNIILTTTMWLDVEEELGSVREKELEKKILEWDDKPRIEGLPLSQHTRICLDHTRSLSPTCP